MQEVSVSTMLTFPNIFPSSLYPQLEVLALLSKGQVIINRPNKNQLQTFCQQNGITLCFSPDSNSKYTQFQRVFITYTSDQKYMIQFRSAYRPAIMERGDWQHLTEKTNSNLRFESFVPYLYQLTLACNILIQEGFDIEYDDRLQWIESSHSPIPIPTITPRVTPFPHQQDNYDRFFRENTCGCLICDDAGMGKTITIGIILHRLHTEQKAKNMLWVVPYYALADQIKNEMKAFFGIDVEVVSGENYTPQQRQNMQQCPYLTHSFVVTTWGTFYKDWHENFELFRHIQFDSVVFDEMHIAKEKKTTYLTMQNLRAKYRFGLTGTPTPNGDWNELYDVIYVINPFLVKPYKDYEQEFYRILKNYEENPVISNGYAEDPKKTANRVMNTVYIPELMENVYRHHRGILNQTLPQIKELVLSVDPTPEEIELTLLFDELYTALTYEKRANYNSMVIRASHLLINQEMYKFCAFGKAIAENRIEKILASEKESGKYLQATFGDKLQNIQALYDKYNDTQLRPYAKFSALLKHLEGNTSHRIVIFCGDSVQTAMDLGFFLHAHTINTRVITGKSGQLTQYKDRLKQLGQTGKMDEPETKDILTWFWSPFRQLSQIPQNIPASASITYKLDDQYISLPNEVQLANAKEIQIIASGQFSIRSAFFSDLEQELNEMDQTSVFQLTPTTLKIIFHPFHDRSTRILVTTDKLEQGCNLQVASTVVFYTYPYNIQQYDQRSSRICRIGSPFKSVLLVSLLYGMERNIYLKVKDKYRNVAEMGFAQAQNVKAKELPMFDAFKEYVQELRKKPKNHTLDKMIKK